MKAYMKFLIGISILLFSVCKTKSPQEKALEDMQSEANEFFEMSSDDVIKSTSDSIALKPRHHNTYIERASAYTSKKQFDNALTDYNMALKLIGNSNDSENIFSKSIALEGRGYIFQQKNLYDQAISDYDSAVLLTPKRGFAYYRRGVLRCLKGDKKNGCSDLRIAQKLEPLNDLFFVASDNYCDGDNISK